MDSSWLLEEDDVASLESDKSDCEEVEHELESRLYSIVHHNDLSQPLPEKLSQHFSLHHSDDGEVTVTLKQPLEQLISEEVKYVNEVLDPHEPISGKSVGAEEVVEIPDDNDVIIVSKLIKCQNSNKRLRYSDVNIDQWNELQKFDNNIYNFGTIKKATLDETREFISEIDLLKNLVSEKKCKEFSDIKFPSLLGLSNWKSNSNASFIPIGKKAMVKKPIFKHEFLKALKNSNPGVAKNKLYRLVNIIFKMKNFKNDLKPASKKKLKKLMRKNVNKGLDIMSNFQIKGQNWLSENRIIKHNETPSKNNFHKLPQNKNENNISLNISPLEHSPPTVHSKKIIDKQNSKSKSKKKINGSISLKSSPFRPTPLFTEMGLKDGNYKSNNEIKLPSHSTKISQPFIPTKWSKKMIDFYTMPSNKKLQRNISSIFHKFNRTTNAEDWLLDPLDEFGVYHRPVTGKKKTQRRCTNCKQRDHSAQTCLEPKRVNACFLCGDYYHSGYNCYKTICMKCGVYSPEGECAECYYQTFDFNSTCERCGSYLHKTLNCPDSWRSFHSTIEGDLKIPETSMENRRKFCCNCARKGHFAHKCPTPLHTGQQINPFVTNYSNITLQQGTTEIFFSKKFEEIINCPKTGEFFQNLSTASNAVISLNQQYNGTLLTVNGTFEQCTDIKSKVESYMNTRKRKREEPPIWRKRRRLK